MGRSIERLREQKLGEAFVKRGGRRDKRQLFMEQEIGRRDSPVPSAASANRNRSPAPGQVFNDAEASDDKGPQDQPEPASREDIDDFRHRCTHGRLRGARGGFFSAVPRPPPPRGGLRPFASPSSHRTNRMWAASAAAAQPQIATEGGAVNSRSLGDSARGYEGW